MTLLTPTKAELKDILETMDVPEARMKMKAEDLRWMLRNLGINNGNHPKFQEAIKLVKYALMSD